MKKLVLLLIAVMLFAGVIYAGEGYAYIEYVLVTNYTTGTNNITWAQPVSEVYIIKKSTNTVYINFQAHDVAVTDTADDCYIMDELTAETSHTEPCFSTEMSIAFDTTGSTVTVRLIGRGNKIR